MATAGTHSAGRRMSERYRQSHAISGRMGHVTWASRQQDRKLAVRSSSLSRESRLQGAHHVDAATPTCAHPAPLKQGSI